MRALVTGAAGFIGSHLTESLLEEGATVVGVDCLTDNYERDQKLRNIERTHDWDNFEFVRGDLVEKQLSSLCHGYDIVFHLAAEPGVRDSWGPRFNDHVRNNVLATQRLLEAMKTQQGTRLIFASSSSVYGEAERFPTPESTTPKPVSPYGVTKLAAEHLCATYRRNYGVDTVSLRYFSVYGPHQRPDMAFHQFFRAALEGRRILIYGDGTQTRDFTFVSDAVAATKAAATAEPFEEPVFNVGGGAQVSVGHAIDLISQAVGRPLEVEHAPPSPGDVRDTGADTTRAFRAFSYRPSTPLEVGLRAELEWMIETVERERTQQ